MIHRSGTAIWYPEPQHRTEWNEEIMLTDEREPTEPTWLPDWQGASYAENTDHHRRFDEWFLADLPLRPTDSVLDIGCGSGDFTRVLAARVPDGHVVGVDAQPSMIDEARRVAAPNQSFAVSPAQTMAAAAPVADGAPYDLVVSRAALHWVPAADHPAVLAQAFDLLAPGGWLRIDAGGGDNVARLAAWLDPMSARYGGPATPWTFFGAGAYLALLEAAGFDVSTEVGGWVRTTAQHRPFDRASIVGWLTSQCVAAYQAGMAAEHREAFAAEVLERVDEFRLPDGTYDQIFVRLDVLARRP
jgi:trans-aconitate methyltransferase